MKDMTRPSVQVAMMNSAFGNPAGDVNNPNWEAIERQMAIISKEHDELVLAVQNRQIHGVQGIRDGIADLNVTNLGLAHIAGIDTDADMAVVFESNMSKFCTNDSELHASQQKYANIGVDTYAEGEYPRKCIKSAKDQTATTGEFFKQGKFLKGINFKEPNLDPYPVLNALKVGGENVAE